MNISVKDLDLGYTQCADLNSLSDREGATIISDLESNVTSLKSHWVGSDATEHVNNLILVHDALVELITDAKKLTSAAASAMISIQEVRKSNGGVGEVGSQLSSAAPASALLARVEPTTEYKCEPSATADQTMLESICAKFDTFKTKFAGKKDELLQNWTDGANRAEAVKSFDTFMGNAETYKKYLTEANADLLTAVNNIAKL